MKVAVAAPPYPQSLNDALHWVEKLSREAAQQDAAIICFPESYLPGYPAPEFSTEKCTGQQLRSALDTVCTIAKDNNIAIIIPMDWYEGDHFLNVAQVVVKTGEVLGYQTKNQLDPSEDDIWQAGTDRHIFEVDGLKFGIVICHEGFRYPETVRQAAMNGAHIVFHPNLSGSNFEGREITEWGDKHSPYYEKAQMVRALENTIYFAPSNYSFLYPESASAIISPDGTCLAYQQYSQPGVAIADIDIKEATGKLAKRFKRELYK